MHCLPLSSFCAERLVHTSRAACPMHACTTVTAVIHLKTLYLAKEHPSNHEWYDKSGLFKHS